MGRLSAPHVNEFAAVKDLCYSELDSATLRERVGDRMARHLGASSYCFGANDPATALPVHSVSVGLEPSVMHAFFGLVLATPLADFGRWVGRPRRAAVLDELVDDVECDPYMTEVLRPSGLRHEVQVACVSGGWSWGHACIRRRAGDGAFAGHEVRFLDALAPHLAAGLRAAASRATLAATPGSQTGIVVLGPDGTVEMANGVAERLFRQPVSGTRHCFLTGVNIVAARLERTLQAGTAGPVPELTLTDETSLETYRLRAERVLGTDGLPRGLVVIEPAASHGASPQLQTLAELGLTPRESQVALAIVRGCTTAEIAAELVVSPHTVQDHVRNVYDKLDVRSRQQLAARLLAGARH
jgi:DNA-binding CsgD family transcriptional regulator